METKEVVVVEQERFDPVAMDEMERMIAYTREFIQNILKPETDYGIIPGTSKPCLYKAGAEKLCFAFGLEAEYEILHSVEDPFKDWEYTATDYQTKEKLSTSVRGYYKFTVSCKLIHRNTGIVWGVGTGICESTERGRETAPANTILKMAQKRAHTGITLNATFTSDRFTADIEGYRGDQRPEAPTKSKVGEFTVEKRIKSKYSNSKCGFCGRKHINEGDPVVLCQKTWGDPECLSGWSPNGPKKDMNVQEWVDKCNEGLMILAETDEEKADQVIQNAVEAGRLAGVDLSKSSVEQLSALHAVIKKTIEKA